MRGRLRSSFESRFEDAEAANDELSLFIEDDLDAEAFWDAVAANLKERHLRLVFVADRIPPELRSIVELLNEQLQLTEVIAVEIKQYSEPDGERVNIVPRIIGETEMARRVKRPGGAARRSRRSGRSYSLVRASSWARATAVANRLVALVAGQALGAAVVDVALRRPVTQRLRRDGGTPHDRVLGMYPGADHARRDPSRVCNDAGDA
jgi:hypothetical protein